VLQHLTGSFSARLLRLFAQICTCDRDCGHTLRIGRRYLTFKVLETMTWDAILRRSRFWRVLLVTAGEERFHGHFRSVALSHYRLSFLPIEHWELFCGDQRSLAFVDRLSVKILIKSVLFHDVEPIGTCCWHFPNMLSWTTNGRLIINEAVTLGGLFQNPRQHIDAVARVVLCGQGQSWKSIWLVMNWVGTLGRLLLVVLSPIHDVEELAPLGVSA